MIFCLVDLESVNTNCKKKIGELNVCKSEISNLSKIVEERLGKDYGGINQMLIQTAEDGNMLTSESLLQHMDVLKKATRVRVEMDDM